MKRVLIISDLHCGHIAGLTPPEYQMTDQNNDMWNFYKSNIESLGDIDVLIANGDLIDGKGERSGGTELISAKIKDQCNMASQAINLVKAKKNILIYGTPYHTGIIDDFEDFITTMSDISKIGGHEWLKVYNTMFDIKHKIGGSTIPHGRYTPLAKEKLWNMYWQEIGGQPKSDIFIRSHVHYFDFCGNNKYLAVTTPALQGYGSKYGVRQCSGVVNIGMIYFDVFEDGKYSMNPIIFEEIIKYAPKVIEI